MLCRLRITMQFDADCKRCKRLADFLTQVRCKHPDYYCKPVPAFGDPAARFLIVGLAPGLHGANRSGRPFTGDHAGILLYQTLYDMGFSSQPISGGADDELILSNCRITNAVKCLPPQNKPTADEIRSCNTYLQTEIEGLPKNAIILALGKIAHDAVLRARALQLSKYRFRHASNHVLPGGIRLISSYHCSRYNTQTQRLTEAMFKQIFVLVKKYLLAAT